MKCEIESSARFLILFTYQIFYDMMHNLANFRLYNLGKSPCTADFVNKTNKKVFCKYKKSYNIP